MILNVIEVQVITGLKGPDVIDFTIDKCEGMWPHAGNATLKLECANGCALRYLWTNYPDLMEVQYLNLLLTEPKWVTVYRYDTFFDFLPDTP
jgi:hypothetical protein